MLSIYVRVPYDRPPDATWDLLNVSLLSLTELFIGIVVSCMPSLLKVLQHHGPAFQSLRSSFSRSRLTPRSDRTSSRNASKEKYNGSPAAPTRSSSKNSLWSAATRLEAGVASRWHAPASRNASSANGKCRRAMHVQICAQNDVKGGVPLGGLRHPSGAVKTSISAGSRTPAEEVDRISVIPDGSQRWSSRV